MAAIKEEIPKLMAAVRKKGPPSSETIVEEAFQKLKISSHAITPEYLQKNFSQILNKVWLETLKVLENYESRVYLLKWL